jgi:hypothetical protein
MYGDFAIPKSKEKEWQKSKFSDEMEYVEVEKPIEWALGFRVPIQVNFHFKRLASVFLTVAPGYELEFVPSFDVGNFRVPVTLGVLFWL